MFSKIMILCLSIYCLKPDALSLLEVQHSVVTQDLAMLDVQGVLIVHVHDFVMHDYVLLRLQLVSLGTETLAKILSSCTCSAGLQ